MGNRDRRGREKKKPKKQAAKPTKSPRLHPPHAPQKTNCSRSFKCHQWHSLQPVSPLSLRRDPVLTIPTAVGRARKLSSSSGVSRCLSLGFTPDSSLRFPTLPAQSPNDARTDPPLSQLSTRAFH